ncbi:hypothetical protein DAEQUDRAFT_348261 [Daedalea quercina L-15889]|uniref:Uncharacterized protein n=1 Tax=Daedalea quercina L-15889 TaxID=1314783 RepID=A0A165PD59_9APHY|nr:hypothetical protein DAEQUDRAFT_348261 [Daedalea quercina L-15889]
MGLSILGTEGGSAAVPGEPEDRRPGVSYRGLVSFAPGERRPHRAAYRLPPTAWRLAPEEERVRPSGWDAVAYGRYATYRFRRAVREMKPECAGCLWTRRAECRWFVRVSWWAARRNGAPPAYRVGGRAREPGRRDACRERMSACRGLRVGPRTHVGDDSPWGGSGPGLRCLPESPSRGTYMVHWARSSSSACAQGIR